MHSTLCFPSASSKAVGRSFHTKSSGVTCNLHVAVIGWSAACDFFLAFYPALIFWKLQVSWQRRLGLIALFAGGSV